MLLKLIKKLITINNRQNKNIDAIKDYYGYSDQKAKDVLGILSGEQLSFIHESLNKGGLKNDRRAKSRSSRSGKSD